MCARNCVDRLCSPALNTSLGMRTVQEEITHCRAGVRWLSHLHAAALDRENPGSDAPAWVAEARSFPSVEPWFHHLVRTNFKGSLKVRAQRCRAPSRKCSHRLDRLWHRAVISGLLSSSACLYPGIQC